MIENIDNEEILKAIIENSYNSIVITDANLELPGPKIVYVNQTFIELTGYTKEELIGETPRILQGELTSRKLLDELKEKCSKNQYFEGQTINYKKDGTPYQVQWNISPIQNKNKETTHFVSIQINVTKELETNAILQKMLDLQKNLVVVTDGLKLTYINQTFKEFFNVQDLEEFLAQDDCVCSRFIETEGFYYRTTENEDWIESIQRLSSEHRIVSMLDKVFIPHGFFVSINDFGNGKKIITFTDITESICEKENFKHKAYHDNLTKAYSREFLNSIFTSYKQSVEKEKLQVGLILFDIDYFKLVNDTYGHNIGDEVIKKIVDITRDTIRTTDYIIRWGGEEFIVLAKVKTIEQLQKIAENIRVAIENENFTPVPKVTSSFGITLLNHKDDLISSIKNADDGLYEAKENGRNRVFVKSNSK